jgi:hypothetical protein
MTPPVLVVVFNRPDCTSRHMGQIARAKPTRLYVAADGPRSKDEKDLCRRVRQIATTVSWECEVRTLLRDENVGCKLGVSGAIDWFFEKEEKGIILEDDCIPSDSFFDFCQELLLRYENDERVGAIAGSNMLRSAYIPESYYFSRYPLGWGWATWARAWRNCDIEMKAWPSLRQTDFLSKIGRSSPGFKTYWTDIFDRCYNGDISTWDYQWGLSFWQHGYSACVPAKNLIQNIGFDGGTHDLKYREFNHGRSAYDLNFPIIHPTSFVQRADLDRAVDILSSRRRRALHLLFQRYIPFGGFTWNVARNAFRKVRPVER